MSDNNTNIDIESKNISKKAYKKLILGGIFLLLLLIGGTLAYIGVTSSSSTTIEVAGEVPEIGNVSLTGTDITGDITLDIEDVSFIKSGTDYTYPSSGQAATIATISASGEYADAIIYYCKVDVTVTNTLTNGTLLEGDASITYGGSLQNRLKKNSTNLLYTQYLTTNNSTLSGSIATTTTDEFSIRSGEVLTLTELVTIHNTLLAQDNLANISFTTKTEVTNLTCDTKSNAGSFTPIELLNTNKGTGGLSDHVSGGLYRYQGNTQTCSYDSGNKIVVNTSGSCSDLYSYTITSSGTTTKYSYQSSCPNNADTDSCTTYHGTLVEDVANYLCIGSKNCSTNKNNADSHTYRILGITPEGNLKVIKMFNDGNRQWGTSNDLNYDWSNSPLQIYLNTETSGGFLYKLGNYKDIVLTKDWYYPKTFDVEGDVKTLRSSVNYVGNTGNATSQYANDTNTTRLATLSAKVGLMNLSDFYYASCDICGFSTTVWLNSANNQGSGYWEWTSFRNSSNSAWGVGTTAVNGRYLTNTDAVRPVLYLSSDIHLSGTGTKGNPYVLIS